MEKKKSEPSQEFTERKELIRLQTIADDHRHELRIEELKVRQENEIVNHENSLTRGRIKNAEMRKTDERKMRMREYPRGPE